MNKSKIDWCDMSFNPVTGCKHECEYCYAKRIAERFMPQKFELMNIEDCKPIIPISKENLGCYECESPVVLTNFKGEKIRTTPYPQGFKPTFHKYRLDEPQRFTKPRKIFVCSMADLFGDWVPDEWIKKVFKACWKAPQHRYIFLTKNPNSFLGFTVENQAAYDSRCKTISINPGDKHFLSIEPLLGPINLKRQLGFWCEWVIVGGQTGPKAVPPKQEWVRDIIDQCRSANVPIFLKDNLHWHEKIQEFPEGLRL